MLRRNPKKEENRKALRVLGKEAGNTSTNYTHYGLYIDITYTEESSPEDLATSRM